MDDLDEILQIFLQECDEGLLVAEEGLSAMVADDASSDVIAGVFRAVHSIKGGSGAFGHTALQEFAHRFESVLDEIRGGGIVLTEDMSGTLLGSFDILSDHVAAVRVGSPPPDDSIMAQRLDALLLTKGTVVEQAPVVVQASAPVTPVEEADPFGFEPVTFAFDDFDAPSWRVSFKPSAAAMANGAEPVLVLRELERLGGHVIAVETDDLPELRELNPQEGYFTWVMEIPAGVAEEAIRECFDFVAPDSVIEVTQSAAAMEAPAEGLEPDVALAAEAVSSAPAEPAATTAAKPQLKLVASAANGPARPDAGTAESQAVMSIRVDLTKLDRLLNLVGELVIRKSILADRLAPDMHDKVELPELSRLTRELQDSVMALRAQPIRQAFSRVPRLLRDLSAETGKKAILITEGDATEVDKSVIERIGEPLTHMIRNAVDHGIEAPQERIALGKPAEGTITLSAEQKGSRIFVRLSDDGRGIDRERVRAKAIEKGLIAPDADLSDAEIDDLICSPGFSTAASVSNISGRGVGMDVVRSNVEALGGRVEISSVPGAGTTLTLSLPLSLAILDGMIVRVCDQRFVIPLASVVEAIRPEPGQVQKTSPTSEVFALRGSYLPLRRLSQIFSLHSGDPLPAEDSTVVVVETGTTGTMALMIDCIDDRREVVIKSLETNLHPVPGLGGATILGDGSIALILDVEALLGSERRAAPTTHLIRGAA